MPAALVLAVVLVLAEAVALVGNGLALLPALRTDRLVMGLSSAGFFLTYGAFLAVCAWRLYRLHSWARAPLVLAQLIQAMVALSFWGGSTTPLALVLLLTAVLVLVGVFHPSSLAALSEE